MNCSDDLRDRYPKIFAAVHSTAIPIEADLVRYLVHWLGDYIRIKAQPGQSGVPEGVVAAQLALAEAHATASDCLRQAQSESLIPNDSLNSGYELSTAEAAAALGISASGVRYLCANGTLESRKVGRPVMVTASSVENYKAHRAKRSA